MLALAAGVGDTANKYKLVVEKTRAKHCFLHVQYVKWPGMERQSAERVAGPVPGGVLGLLAEPLSERLVCGALREVIDPELGANIVDLGLVYGIALDRGAGAVSVVMTLTTPGCPLSDFMDDEIRSRLAHLPQVHEISVQLVWEPPWSPLMMSADARRSLGWG